MMVLVSALLLLRSYLPSCIPHSNFITLFICFFTITYSAHTFWSPPTLSPNQTVIFFPFFLKNLLSFISLLPTCFLTPLLYGRCCVKGYQEGTFWTIIQWLQCLFSLLFYNNWHLIPSLVKFTLPLVFAILFSPLINGMSAYPSDSSCRSPALSFASACVSFSLSHSTPPFLRISSIRIKIV